MKKLKWILKSVDVYESNDGNSHFSIEKGINGSFSLCVDMQYREDYFIATFKKLSSAKKVAQLIYNG